MKVNLDQENVFIVAKIPIKWFYLQNRINIKFNGCKIVLLDVNLHSKIKWPVRLSARTSGFHPGKRGSIPLRATSFDKLNLQSHFIPHKL